MRIAFCLLVLAAASGSSLLAGDRCCDGVETVCCPACDYVCRFSCEKVTETNHCYNVECKPICIPRVTFPWQKCCEADCGPARCAKVKVVNTLVKKEYECTRCQHKWTPVRKGCCNGCNQGTVAKPNRDTAFDFVKLPEVQQASFQQPLASPNKRLRRLPQLESSDQPARKRSYAEIISGFFSK